MSKKNEQQPDLMTDQEGGETESTTVEKQPVVEKRKYTRRSTARQKVAFSLGEVEQKLYLIFSAVAKLTKREMTYTEQDFDSEAKGIMRLSDKFDGVYDVVMALDPLMIIVGLIIKFTGLKKAPKAEKSNAADAA